MRWLRGPLAVLRGRWRVATGLVLAVLLSLGGCKGDIGPLTVDPEGSGASPGADGIMPVSIACANAGPQPGRTPIRRLTRTEYNNTVHDLLNDTTAPATQFTPEEVGLGFTNNAEVQTVSDLLAEQFESAASTLAAAATANLPKLLSCTPTPATEDACLRAFLPAFGMKVYRRPLDAVEVERLFEFYAKSKQTYDFATAVRLTVESMLQSPHFLYRVETGKGAVTGTVSKLSAFETASRLSYLLWSTMPDDALFAAAAAGELDTPEGIARQAQRMLKDARTKQSVGAFFSQWLDLDKLDRVDKDLAVFPRFTREIRGLLRRETELFAADVVFGGGGNMDALLRGAYTFMNKPLADYYGLTGPQTNAFEKVALDSNRRAGLLTQAGLLASYANINQTSPIARGFFVRERFLCAPPPPPPANVNAKPPDFNPALTTRERFAAHRTSPSCSGCHRLMDPIGLGFEHFDGAGQWRDDDAGRPVDATGEFVDTRDIDGPFDGVVELATKLSQSAQARECMARQWFRFGYGRGESEADQCTLDALNAAFALTHGDINQLLVTLTQTDVFLYRNNEQGGSP
jgi:hypothetical protein